MRALHEYVNVFPVHLVANPPKAQQCCGTARQNLSLIHISEPTRPRLISYAVFCLKKKWKKQTNTWDLRLETWAVQSELRLETWDLRLETWANLRGLAKYLYNTRASCMIITTYSPLSHTKISVRQFCRAVPQHCCALGGFATKCTRNTFTYSCNARASHR